MLSQFAIFFTLLFSHAAPFVGGPASAAVAEPAAPAPAAKLAAAIAPAGVKPRPAPPVTRPAAPATVALNEQPIPPQIAAPTLPSASYLGLPVVFGQLATDRLSADAVVDRVQTFYKDTQHLRAKFRQTSVTKAFGRKQVSDGRLYILKPGKMRWDYYKAKKQGGTVTNTKSFISDGTTLWAVNHDDKQYASKALKDDVLPVAVTFLTGEGDLRRDFNVAEDKSGKYGRKSDYVVVLTPKAPSAQYKMLILVVDPTNYRVRESIVINAAGDTNSIRFYEPDAVKPIKGTLFTFNPTKHKDYRQFDPEQVAPKN